MGEERNGLIILVELVYLNVLILYLQDILEIYQVVHLYVLLLVLLKIHDNSGKTLPTSVYNNVL